METFADKVGYKYEVNNLKKTIITNNSLVYEKFSKEMDIIFKEDYSYLDILKYVRDKVHKGHKLLTHPLSGSVKPNETPFKSVAISIEKGPVDFKSLAIIEESTDTAKKFIEGRRPPNWTEKVLDDFRLIDYHLIKSAVESMDQFY
ncbi:MAG: hypothetical protein PWQ37_2983 [Candidatus Petromonas sp.]|nr:hypothetical protein [Candidatus Petromonas sp.]